MFCDKSPFMSQNTASTITSPVKGPEEKTENSNKLVDFCCWLGFI